MRMEIDSIIKPYLRALNRGTDIDNLIEIIIDEQDEGHNFDKDSIREALLLAQKPLVNEIKMPSKSSKPPINGNRYRDLPRKQYQKTMECLTDIVKIVDNNQDGITKTGILRLLRRENSYWRPKITRWLYELCEDGVIQTDKNKTKERYYSYDAHVENREQAMHRKVAEALQIHGDMTQNQIAIKIGRNGGLNRHQVVNALNDLERKGFLEKGERSRWRWTL
jgi:predicted transcriptional regulator